LGCAVKAAGSLRLLAAFYAIVLQKGVPHGFKAVTKASWAFPKRGQQRPKTWTTKLINYYISVTYKV